jgi:hypothetical protein
MDIANILQKIAFLNKQGSQLTPIVSKIVDHINMGKMIYDANRGVEKPDPNWHQATLILQKCKDTLSPDIFKTIISDIQKFTKPHKLERFKAEWIKWLQRDNGIEFESIPSAVANSNIQKLLKMALSISENNTIENKIIRLINSHVEHIVGLIERNKIEQAKEYLDIIRPIGWEDNAERNVDKVYEMVVRKLSEKLNPEAFQAIGL